LFTSTLMGPRVDSIFSTKAATWGSSAMLPQTLSVFAPVLAAIAAATSLMSLA
jgi:hypothetical protein